LLLLLLLLQSIVDLQSPNKTAVCCVGCFDEKQKAKSNAHDASRQNLESLRFVFLLALLPRTPCLLEYRYVNRIFCDSHKLSNKTSQHNNQHTDLFLYV